MPARSSAIKETANLRKIIYFVTASLDGFVARADGRIDWLIQPEGNEDFGFAAFLASIDTVVQGRKTYEQVLTFGPYPYADRKNYVFSRKLLQTQHAEVVRQPVPDFVRWLRQQPGRDIWLVGGGELAAAFFQARAVDQVKVFVQPIVLGEGLPLVKDIGHDIRLQLTHTQAYRQGLVQMDYDVRY